MEVVVRGDYYQKNGKHYILYEEVLEGFDEAVRNVIKAGDGSMDIIKRGPAAAICSLRSIKSFFRATVPPWGI